MFHICSVRIFLAMAMSKLVFEGLWNFAPYWDNAPIRWFHSYAILACSSKVTEPFCFRMLNNFVKLVFFFVCLFFGLVQDPGWSWRWTEALLDQSSPPPRPAQQLACYPSLRLMKRRRWSGVWSTSLHHPQSTMETWRRSCWTPSTSRAAATPPATGGIRHSDRPPAEIWRVWCLLSFTQRWVHMFLRENVKTLFFLVIVVRYLFTGGRANVGQGLDLFATEQWLGIKQYCVIKLSLQLSHLAFHPCNTYHKAIR